MFILGRDLEKLSGYDQRIVQQLQKRSGDFITIYDEWQRVAETIKNLLQSERGWTYALEDMSLQSFTPPKGKRAIGINGPGSVGKGLVSKQLALSRVVNTTTRAKRATDVDGLDYHFLSSEKFAELEQHGSFLTVTERPGRGRYGISHNAVDAVLDTNDAILVEENPYTLRDVFKKLSKEKRLSTVIIYLLPPEPAFAHLLARLATRCESSGEELTTEYVAATLGGRQIEEFYSALSIYREGANVLFLVNDDVQRVVSFCQERILT